MFYAKSVELCGLVVGRIRIYVGDVLVDMVRSYLCKIAF